jgi:hypothetical protein
MKGMNVEYKGYNMIIEESYTSGFPFELTVSVNTAIQKILDAGLTPILIFLTNEEVRVHSSEIKKGEFGTEARMIAVEKINQKQKELF